MQIPSNFVLVTSKDFFLSIHKNSLDKLDELSSVVRIEIKTDVNYQTLEEVTFQIMKSVKKSDHNFLLWLHFIGYYIKSNNKGFWALIKRDFGNWEYFAPAIIAPNKQIWIVGEFCYDIYYKKKRMYGIGFEFFYKLHIQQLAWKQKVSELNIYADDIIKLESEIENL